MTSSLDQTIKLWKIFEEVYDSTDKDSKNEVENNLGE